MITKTKHHGGSGNPPKSTQAQFFPEGPQDKCPKCGYKVVLPCLACETEASGKCRGPEEEDKPLLLDLELFGKAKKRYEFVKKIREEYQMTLSEYKAKLRGEDKSAS